MNLEDGCQITILLERRSFQRPVIDQALDGNRLGALC